MPATDDDTLLPFSLPGICQKKITAAFDGGLISCYGGVLLLAGADKRHYDERCFLPIHVYDADTGHRGGTFMPRSKHRRKPGGKAVAHPGRGKPRELRLSPEQLLWHRFADGYTGPFHEQHGDRAVGGAGYMLDVIEEAAFVATGNGHLQPVSKAEVFRQFMVSPDLEDETPARDAEAALVFLVEQGMVEVAGDEITVPASFWSDGQVPVT